MTENNIRSLLFKSAFNAKPQRSAKAAKKSGQDGGIFDLQFSIMEGLRERNSIWRSHHLPILFHPVILSKKPPFPLRSSVQLLSAEFQLLHKPSPCMVRVGETMISPKEIAAYARVVAERFRPEKIILFGSYAGGKATEESDVDLLVIMEHNKPRNIDQALSIRLQHDAAFPLDLLVRRPADIQERLAIRDTFIRDILTDGQVLYG